jgi:hypothetical protein
LAVGQVKSLELGVFLPWFFEPVYPVSSEVPCAGLSHTCQGWLCWSYMGMMGGIEVGLRRWESSLRGNYVAGKVRREEKSTSRGKHVCNAKVHL